VDELLSNYTDQSIIVENNGNEDASIEVTQDIENNGGKVWENDSGLMKLTTQASTTIAFQFHVNAGADVDWYLDGQLHTESSNNAIFFFDDSTSKVIEIRGADVLVGAWLEMTGKQLVGVVDLSSMEMASARIDFSNNALLTQVILPRSDQDMDQCMAYGTGISDLRLDKLPGLVNFNAVQIRMGDCPNLNTDNVARNILSVDHNSSTGRQFWYNGSTPKLSSELVTAMQANGWTLVP
jgi:hypothetical protein